MFVKLLETLQKLYLIRLFVDKLLLGKTTKILFFKFTFFVGMVKLDISLILFLQVYFRFRFFSIWLVVRKILYFWSQVFLDTLLGHSLTPNLHRSESSRLLKALRLHFMCLKNGLLLFLRCWFDPGSKSLNQYRSMSWQLLLERLLFSQLLSLRRNIWFTIIHVHNELFCPCFFDCCIITARPLVIVVYIFDPYEALRIILVGFTMKAFGYRVLISVHFPLRIMMVLLVLNHAYILSFLTSLRLECKYCLIFLQSSMLMINQRFALLTMVTSWGRDLWCVKSAIIVRFSLLYLATMPVTYRLYILILHRSLGNFN